MQTSNIYTFFIFGGLKLQVKRFLKDFNNAALRIVFDSVPIPAKHFQLLHKRARWIYIVCVRIYGQFDWAYRSIFHILIIPLHFVAVHIGMLLGCRLSRL